MAVRKKISAGKIAMNVASGFVGGGLNIALSDVIETQLSKGGNAPSQWIAPAVGLLTGSIVQAFAKPESAGQAFALGWIGASGGDAAYQALQMLREGKDDSDAGKD